MRLYVAVAVRGFRRYATYRIATLAGVFTNTVFGLIVSYTYIALWRVRPHLGGYDLGQAVTFVWLGQALLMTTSLLGNGFEAELIDRIRTGDVAIDLYRPADPQAWWLATDLGRAGFHLLGRGVLPMVVAGLFFPLVRPGSVARWAAFLVAVALGVVVSFAIRYLVAMAAFWLLDGSGVIMLSSLTAMFFSGMVLPLNVFPSGLGTVARALPWSALLQVPADVFLGREHGVGGVAGELGFQALWAVLLLGAGRLVQSVATRKVVVQGG
jgi:ABC-2 type transport system permease protein